MACEFICDGCGKRAPACHSAMGRPFKPRSWYARTEGNKELHAGSRECIETIREKTGDGTPIMPW